MVSFVSSDSSNRGFTNNYSKLMNSRMHKRICLKVTLFLRSLINDISYGKKVETINISEKGLLVACDVGLREGMLIEVTTATRKVEVIAEVKHSSYDAKTKKYLIGLCIREKRTGWFVLESDPLRQPISNVS